MSSTGASRGNPKMGDVVRSVGVLGLILLALWGVGQLVTSTPEQTVKEVDYLETVEAVRPVAGFELLAPPALPDGWRATLARYEPAGWHLRVLTADDDYVGLEQMRLGVESMVDQYAPGSTLTGSVEIGGREWEVRTGPDDGDVTFVHSADDLTTLVTGDAPRAEIERYIASLRS